MFSNLNYYLKSKKEKMGKKFFSLSTKQTAFEEESNCT